MISLCEPLPAVVGEQALPAVEEPVHSLPVLSQQQAAHHPPHTRHQASRQEGTRTVRKVLADFAVCDCYCKALCDVKFRQLEGNGRTFRHIELSVIS